MYLFHSLVKHEVKLYLSDSIHISLLVVQLAINSLHSSFHTILLQNRLNADSILLVCILQEHLFYFLPEQISILSPFLF